MPKSAVNIAKGMPNEFINRAKNGKLYHMNWSRFLDETKYSKTVSNLIKAKCQ